MTNIRDQEQLDLQGSVPTEETEKQYYYMVKARQYVQALAKQLGHTPTCCVTTFGCHNV